MKFNIFLLGRAWSDRKLNQAQSEIEKLLLENGDGWWWMELGGFYSWEKFNSLEGW